jgi:hypothetical protein
MNAERLHSLAVELAGDASEVGSLSLLQRLRDHLRTLVSQPQDPTAQQQVSALLSELISSLRGSRVNEFPPVWRDDLEELGLMAYLGDELADRVEQLFARNQITPSLALEEIEEITGRMEEIHASVSALTSAFGVLGIQAEGLEPGEAEVGVLIPRAAVHNSLRGLGDELTQLQKILNPFSELAIGSRPAFPLRTIASTDFNVFLDSPLAVAAAIAVGVERVAAFYKQLLEIRLLRQQLVEQQVPEAALTGVDEHAGDLMSQTIGEVVTELMSQYGQDRDAARGNELQVELTWSLKNIAKRLDLGYHVTVRAEWPEVEEGEEGAEPEQSEDDVYLEQIQDAAPGLQSFDRSGEPILRELDPGDDPDTDDSDQANEQPSDAS